LSFSKYIKTLIESLAKIFFFYQNDDQFRQFQAENRASEFERQTNKMQKENESLEGKLS